jgi:hypothetical protein
MTTTHAAGDADKERLFIFAPENSMDYFKT